MPTITSATAANTSKISIQFTKSSSRNAAGTVRGFALPLV